jgi:hypothetical protein
VQMFYFLHEKVRMAMRIRLGWSNGTVDEVLGDIETTSDGLVYFGRHKRVVRERVREAHRMVNVDQNWAIADPSHGPARPEDGTWVQLSDEQVLRVLLDNLSHSWLNWAYEVPSSTAI